MQPAAHLHVLVTANTSSAVRSLQQTDAQLKATAASAQRTQSQFKSFAKGAAAGFGIGAAAVGISKGARAFVGFDRAMRNVNSLAKLSESQFKALSKQVLKLAGPTAQSPQTLAEGMYELVSSGFKAEKALKVLEVSAKAATAGLTDTGTAAQVITSAIRAYGLEAKDATDVSDTLFRTVDKGRLTFEELAQGIGPVLAQANKLAIPLEQVGAAIATLTIKGFPAAEGFTAIDAAMRALVKPSTDMKQAFKDLGVESGEELVHKFGSFQAALQAVARTTDGSSAAMNKLFNEVRGARGALTLTGQNARDAAKSLDQIRDRAGATDRAFQEMGKSVDVQLKRLSAQLQVAAIRMGSILLPAINVVVAAIVGLQKTTNRVFGAMASFLTNVWKRPLKAFGDLFSSILRGFSKLFDLASHLPGVGGKFNDLRDKANQMAASMDKWGENTESAGGQARKATGRVVNLSKAIKGLPDSKQITIDVGLALKSWDRLQSPQQLLGGGGDGWGLEGRITSQAKEAAEAKIKSDPGSILGSLPGGGSAGLMGANQNLAPFAALGAQFGLSVTSGLRPGSITNSGNVSYHSSGRAIDVNAGSAGQMLMYAKAMATLFGSRLKELIHTPLGFSIKDGQRVAPYAAADHYDHVHVAMQRGGRVPGVGRGDKIPALLEPEEHVLTGKEVQRAGGHSAIFALRRMLGGGTQAKGAGMAKGGAVSNLLAGLNKVFPAHYLGQAGAQLSSDQVRAVAEKWGGLSPAAALQADQITLGESSRHPGIIGQDPGGTLGIGLWQITRGVQGALGKSWIDSRGGDVGMRNPKKNAEVMSIMSGKGSSWSNWYGTRFLQPIQKNVQSVFGSAGAGGATAEIKKKKPKRSIFSRLRKVDLPTTLGPSGKQLAQRIKLLTDAAEIAGDMASRAERVEGEVGGKDQTGWLNEQLAYLFQLRNALIDAESLVQVRRDAYTKAIEQAEKRLERIKVEIDKAADRRRKLEKQLKVEKARPKPSRRKVRNLEKESGDIDRGQSSRVAERKALIGVLPDWRKKRGTLNTRRGELLTSLEGVQGVGSPMQRLVALPQVGVLGGQILDVQLQLQDAAERVTDSSSATTDTSAADNARADQLADLLREANLRTGVSERQFQVLKNFDATSGLQQFATGGIVQAPVGAPLPVIAHGGEGVFTPDQMAAMGGGSHQVSVHVYEGEGRAEVFIDDRKIDAAVERVTRRQSRQAGRGLPGRGGGV